MERVMKQPRYQRNPEYDERYVTQLLDNFRSHEAILHFPNAQFYDSRLRAKAPKAQVDVACGWERLPKKGFPIILHSVLGPSEREPDGFSWFNLHEIKQVVSYVHQLLKNGINSRPVKPQDIGIVSPYKSQITKIEKKLGHIKGLEIGTTEYFQGREKNIMIISTVKSKTSVGFLKNEKVCSSFFNKIIITQYSKLQRLNVAVTRAKFLMIVIGNPETLQKDRNWYQFVKYCHENGACKGDPFKMKEFGDVTHLSQELQDFILIDC